MQQNKVTKKFINSKENIVNESLKGLQILMNQHLDLVFQDKENKYEIPIVSIKAYELLNNNNVRIICGGGSGHEPAHAGYVCKQMLAAAVCGQVFASPSLQQVKKTLEYMIQDKKNVEILVIIKNYTGDLINFESAVEMVRNQYKEKNVNIETLQVGDDVALLEVNKNKKVKARGVAGTCLLYKILGGGSIMGKNLVELKELGEEILKRLYSFGVCMESCVLPGQEQKQRLEDDEMEVGMGIHGETGKEKVKVQGLNEIIHIMLEEIILKRAIQGDVVLMINNLGRVTQLEMSAIVHAVYSHCLSNYPQLQINRIIAGSVMTSLDMNGFSITLLSLNGLPIQFILQSIDLQVDSIFWPKSIIPQISSVQLNKPSPLYQSISNTHSAHFISTIKILMNSLIQNHQNFNDMDSKVGDGDLGEGVNRAAKSILPLLDCLDFDHNFSNSIIKLADVFSDSFAGTSGPLWGVFLSQAATQLDNEFCKNETKNWVEAYKSGLQAMMKVGGAEKNDRTMVDALLFGQEYLNTNQNLTFKGLTKALRNGADYTKQIIAQKGRSAYLDNHVIGLEEPGCELTVFIFHIISNSFQ